MKLHACIKLQRGFFLSSHLPPLVPPLTLYPVTVVISFWKSFFFFLNATKRACYFYILAACSLPLAKFKALNLLDFWSDSEMKKIFPRYNGTGQCVQAWDGQMKLLQVPFCRGFLPQTTYKTPFLFCLSLSWCVTFPYGGYVHCVYVV